MGGVGHYLRALRTGELFLALKKYVLNSPHPAMRLIRDRMISMRRDGSLAVWKKRNYYTSLLRLLVDLHLRNMPQWISFQTTFVCNLRCPHCQTHGTEQLRQVYNSKGMNMSTELLKKAGNEALPWVDTYCLSLSGEPLLTPDFLGVVNGFSSFGARIDLTTNGTLLTADMLSQVLPFLARVCFSVDGATRATYEKNRLGARYATFLTNVKRVTRVVEIAGLHDVEVSLALVIMGNNIRELPALIMLADFLGVRLVHGFFLIVHQENNVEREAVTLHKALYNAYRLEALRLADRHGIRVFFPPPFDDADQTAVDEAIAGMKAAPSLDDDIRQSVDPAGIEDDANKIAQKIRGRALAPPRPPEDLAEECRRDGYLRELAYVYQDKLKSIAENPDAPMKYCEFLHRRMYVQHNGDVGPCCVQGRPTLGNINDNTINEIWNGSKYNEFREKYYSAEPYECCRGCGFSQVVPVKDFLVELKVLCP